MTDTVLPRSEELASGHQRSWRPRRASAGFVAAVAAIGVVAAGGVYELTRPDHPRQPAQSVGAVLRQAMTNALAKRSVHMSVTSVSLQHGTAVFDDDDSVTGGIQRISVYGGHVEVRVIGPTTYFTGDPLGLRKYMGLNARQVRLLRGRWVSLSDGQPGYSTVTAGITLASALDEAGLTGQLRRLPVRIADGQRVFGIHGVPTGQGVPPGAQATLWVSVGSTPLPVEYDAGVGTTTERVQFSGWGEPVSVVPPGNTVGHAPPLT